MKRLLQLIGIRKWSGEDLISLQAEPLKTIDAFFAEYGNCIFNGCEVSAAPGNTYNIAPGFVALQGKDQDNRDTFKVAPFAGLENATLPVYLTLSYNVIEKEYVDGKVKPVAYDYYAAATSVRPAEETPYLEITASGGQRFIDAIGITRKLDKTGNGRDVTVTFNPAAGRENVSSGEKLTTILGKVARWFADLKTVAFSGKTADLTDDAAHRFTTDTEKVGWNDKYTKTETDNKDAAILTASKNYTDALDGKVYKKTETYTRAETDAKVATLGNEVYRKGEVYTRSETDAKDTATLNTAKQYVLDRIAEIVGGSPAALDTLYEIAKALGNDPNFATSIMALVNGKAPLVHTHTKSQITDFPSSMPASDVYSWAKQPTKPAYNAGEVGAAPVSHNHAGTYAPVSHEHEIINGNYTGNGGQQPPSYVPSGKVRFNMMNTPVNGDSSYKDFILMDTYTGGDVPVTTAFGVSKSAALRAFIMQGVKGGAAWNRTAEIYTTANFNPDNYAVVGHNHNGVYQPAGNYAPSNHNHDSVYQPKGSYATANHNHDSAYAAKSHTHPADQISDTSAKVMMTAAERSKLAGLEPGTSTEILSLPADELSFMEKIIYQGIATLVYNIKFAIMVSLNSENMGLYTIDCVIGAQGNHSLSYYVREFILSSVTASLYIRLSVTYSNKQWTIKASYLTTPISMVGLQVSLQPRGIIVFK